MRKQIKQVGKFQKAFEAPFSDEPKILQDRKVLRLRLLLEEVEEYREAIDNNDTVEVADATIDIMYILIGTAHEFGFADVLPEMFDEVHESNMSKLDDNGKPIFREDGKVVKSHNYFKPNLKVILEFSYFYIMFRWYSIAAYVSLGVIVLIYVIYKIFFNG